jgi:hypothetical protein
MRALSTTIGVGVLGLSLAATGLARAESAAAEDAAATEQTQKRPISRTILFPVLVQAPLFGASVTLPKVSIPGGGGGTELPTGTTDTSLNSAWFAGFRMDRERWMLETNGLYAGLSSERTLPRTTVDSRVIGGTATFGWRLGGDWLVTGAARRMGLKITATLEGFNPVTWRPGVWDPLLGLMWRHEAGRNWALEAEFQGGGFGVGSDVDLSGSFNADWRFAEHFGIRLGYSVLHFKVTDTVLTKEFDISQTMQGPSFGLGVYFGKR